MNLNPIRKFLLLAVCVCTLGCGTRGPVKHQVSGIVRVNGQLAERMVVQLASTTTPPPGNLAYPTGITDKDGKFILSTEGERDGAIEGEYKVLFSWMSSPELDGFDMLSGLLADAKTTQYKLTIPPKEPIEFDLAVPEKSIKRPRGSR